MKRLDHGGWWTEHVGSLVWLCWYERMSDPRESRSILTRTIIGIRRSETGVG